MELTSRTIVRRLRAWHLGEPLTRGQTIHTATAEPADRFVLAFVKIGGETRPWGVVWKQGTKASQFRFVPEPRTRADVEAMVSELGPLLAEHLRHPAYVQQPAGSADELAPLRQIWVPNGSHADMLHHLAYSYAFRRVDSDHATELRLLGRTALFAFLESQRPGQQLVMSASDVLRSAFDFPAEDVRQAHLGFLLAWLETRGGRDHGLAAALEAERLPVATALQPELERKELSPVVESYVDARREDDRSRMRKAEDEIGELLRPELERRVDLVSRAIDWIVDDPRPVNAGASVLVRETLKAQFWDYVNPESRAIASGTEPFVPSAETDFQSKSAASRYFRFNASADRMSAALIHDDRELEAEAISSGLAFRGTIIEVRDEGAGTRRTVPVWCIEDTTPGQLRIRRGDGVCVVGHPERDGRVRSIETTKGGALVMEFEITGDKTKKDGRKWPQSMPAADERWIGLNVTVTGTSFADMTDQKARNVRKTDPLAGDWLIVKHGERDVADESVGADVSEATAGS